MKNFLGYNDDPIDDGPDDDGSDDDSNDGNNSGNSGKDGHDGGWDRHDTRDSYVERENACHLNATGDFSKSELNERASSKRDSSLDLLLKENSSKLESNKGARNEFSFNADVSTKEFAKHGNSAERVAAYACEQYEKMLNGLPAGMKDLTPGVSGACKMVETRVEMINTNNATLGYDKYWHCMGNCNAAEYGIKGAEAALAIDTLKEMKDVFKYGIKDSIGDFGANLQGLKGGLSGERCYDVCNNRLPNRYRND